MCLTNCISVLFLVVLAGHSKLVSKQLKHLQSPENRGNKFHYPDTNIASHLCARMVCFRFMDQMDCMLQVLFPLAPGIESIYEPAMEEVEEALEGAQEKMEHMQSELRQEAEQVQRKVKGWVKGGRK